MPQGIPAAGYPTPAYRPTIGEKPLDASPPSLTVRMAQDSPNSLQLITGQTLAPGTVVTITARDWRAMTPETRSATHRLLTDPRRQDQLLGGRYITTISPEHSPAQEISQ